MGASFPLTSMGNIILTEDFGENSSIPTFTSSFYDEEWSKELQVSSVFIVFYFIFVVVILAGNITVLFLLIKIKRLHTITNYYIASLCVSDICVGVFAVPMEIMSHYNERFMSSALCQFLEYFVHVSVASNVYCLIIIAVDRHRNIVQPFLPKLQIRRCALNISIVWLVSFLHGWRGVLMYHVELRQHLYHGNLLLRHECTIRNDLNELYVIMIWFDFLSIYLIPLIILTALYSRIFATFHKSRVRVGNAGPSFGRGKKRVVRMLAAIVLFFAACQFPLHMWRLYVYAGPGIFEGYLVLYQVFDLVAFSNSWLNVIIYVSFNESFRRAYRDRCNCNSSRSATNKDSSRTRTVSNMVSTLRLPRPSAVSHFDEPSVARISQSTVSLASKRFNGIEAEGPSMMRRSTCSRSTDASSRNFASCAELDSSV